MTNFLNFILTFWLIYNNDITVISLNSFTLNSSNNQSNNDINFDMQINEGLNEGHNNEKEKTSRIWCVAAFTPSLNGTAWFSVASNINSGIKRYVGNNTNFNISVVFNEDDIFNTKNTSEFFNQSAIDYIPLSNKENDANDQFNQRLQKIPWSTALEQTSSGIFSIIILTDYWAENLTVTNGNKTLIGQMYVYNEKAYENYLNIKKLNNRTNFRIYNVIPSAPLDLISLTTPPPSSPRSAPKHDSTTSNNSIKIFLICGSIAGIFVIIIVGVFLYQRKKRKADIERLLQNAQAKNSIKRPLERDAPIYDDWELTWDRLVIKNDELHTGVNEQLLHGNLLSDFKNGKFQSSSEVAIKMPNKYALEITKEMFLNEINMMKKLAGDNSIVAMSGCITKKDQLCLVMEFCINLDLLNYVREIRYNKNKIEETTKQTKKEFFIFGWQILHGLQYLRSQLIIHRNLTAKNIVITSNKNAKITDFGLAIHETNKTDDLSVAEKLRLPIKWLAIEALKNFTFSYESDVWAFGVVLYETYSFGETLYADIDTDEILGFLEAGKRLEKPDGCSEKIYEIMLKCWENIPSTRPTLGEIIEVFAEVMKDLTEEYGYLELMESAVSKTKKDAVQQLNSLEI